MWGNIILHKCTINGNYMMCGSWDMKCNRHNFFVILGHFCPFTQNIKILKKWKKHLMVLSFYTSVPKTMIIVYTACYTILCYIVFCPFTFLTAQKIKTLKKWRTCLEISSFYACAQKIWSDDVYFLRYGAQWSNRQTDGQTDRKSDI